MVMKERCPCQKLADKKRKLDEAQKEYDEALKAVPHDDARPIGKKPIEKEYVPYPVPYPVPNRDRYYDDYIWRYPGRRTNIVWTANNTSDFKGYTV